MTNELAVNTAAQHIQDILNFAILHSPQQAALVIFDTQCPLAITLTKAYQLCLPTATFMDYDSLAPETVLDIFKILSPSDLVVLIQSTHFRPKDFRMRVELFELSLKVIEHPHLARISADESPHYIQSLAYDPSYYHGVGHALKKLIDNAKNAVVVSDTERLTFSSALESAKLNIGDYTDMKNIGGQFPIGEVFTEAQDLETVNGRVKIFGFADMSFMLNKPETPITLFIANGRVTEVINSTPEFEQVLTKIRNDEHEVWLRELGFGMNRAFSQDRTVSDIGTYERMCGIHLSLGAKHGVYKKSNFKRGTTWHHVDVFAITDQVYLDDSLIFQNGSWIV